MTSAITHNLRQMFFSRAARVVASSMAIASFARLIQLTMGILLARQLGPSGYGAFTFALGAATIAGQFGALGWPMIMARFIPEYVVKKEWALLRGLVLGGEIVVLTGSAAGALFLIVLTLLPSLSIDITQGLLLGALMTVPIGYRQLKRQQLAAVKRAPLGLFFDELLSPLGLVIVALAITVASAWTAGFIFSIFGIFACLGAAIFFFTISRNIGDKLMPNTAWVCG